MQATDDLRSEHRGVLRMCGILEGLAEELRGGRLLPAEDLDQVLEFLTVFVDSCHHHKEEHLLFPALHTLAEGDTKPLIGQLLVQHDESRALVAEMRAAAGEMGADVVCEQLAETSTRYATLLRSHIETEEEDLFAAADRLLAPQEQARLEAEYERVEEEVVGLGKHEAFHLMLADMEERYAVESSRD